MPTAKTKKPRSTQKKDCTCSRCVERCRTYPGWMSVGEAEAAIAAGAGGRLMRDWLEPDRKVGNTERIYVLCPADVLREGKDAPDNAELSAGLTFLSMMMGDVNPMVCTYLTTEGRCEIHDSGFKPVMCRTSFGCKPNIGQSKRDIAPEWNTPRGRALVARWEKEHKKC